MAMAVRWNTYLEPFEELLGAGACPGIDRQFHFADLLVDLLHEANDKVHQFVLIHLLRVEVGDEEAYVVALDGLAAQYDERLGASHHEPGELVAQYALNLVGLLHGDAHAHRVNGRLDQHLLPLVARHDDGREHQLLAGTDLHLRLVVPLHHLRGEVLQAHRRRQRVSHGGQVGLQCGCHCVWVSGCCVLPAVCCICTFYLTYYDSQALEFINQKRCDHARLAGKYQCRGGAAKT